VRELADAFACGYFKPTMNFSCLTRLSITVVALLGSSGCSSTSEPFAAEDAGSIEAGDAANASDAGAVTYYQHVAPILQAHCVTCHTPGGIAPFALDSAAAAQPVAAAIKLATQSQDMPPWPPGPLSPTFVHDRRLTAEQIATLATWADTGAALGDDQNPAAPGQPEIVDISQADLDLNTGVDYVPDTALSDDYRCFLIDPQVTENHVVTGYRITPGNRKIVHHVITTLFAASDRPTLEALDAESPDRAGWPCFGGAVPTDSPASPDGSLGSWVPGVSAVLLPPGTGTWMRTGDVAVMQVHYNLAGGHDPDRTRIEVQFAPKGTELSLQQLATVRLFKRNLVLPSNQTNIVQEHTLSAKAWRGGNFYPDGEAQIVAVAGHMHTLGTHIAIERTNAQGVSTLLDIPHWDFHWQGSYQLAEPIPLAADDQLTVRCSYDNTAERRAEQGNPSAVVDVHWGEGTTDEMCIGYVTVVNRKPY
jgi:mono/diheme cytochrome c family protein